MNKLIKETTKLLKGNDFDWAICGGYAIDMFCREKTRKHIDIDICVFWEDRDTVIKFIKGLNWTVYEACGGGVVHLVSELGRQKYLKNNIFCVKDGNKLFHVAPISDDMYKCNIDNTEQVELDYIEFLFDKRDRGYFLYSRNENVTREMDKAILFDGGVPYLAPEISLLYKSKEYQREDYEHDFTVATNKMSNDSKNWLVNSLDICYPEGHAWSSRLNNITSNN